MLSRVLLGLLWILALPAHALVGDPQAGASKNQTCVACHGPDGNSTVGMWPKIAGQHEKYIVSQITEFRKGDKGGRFEASMFGMVQGLSDQDIADLAAFYTQQKMTEGKARQDLVERGQALYRGGDFDKKIPACMACHGPQGMGNELANYPRLSGQNAEYTATQLKKYRSGERSNDVNAVMRDVAAHLSDEDIDAVSSYVSGLH